MDVEETQITDLPLCLIMEILLRLPMMTLLACRCVCRSWISVFSDSFFVKLHLQKPPTWFSETRVSDCLSNKHGRRIPKPGKLRIGWIVDTGGDDFHFETSEDFGSNLTFLTREFLCYNSCNGLICLQSGKFSATLVRVINPILGEWIGIPVPIKPRFRCSSLAFGFCPKSNQYKVVCAVRPTQRHLYVRERVHEVIIYKIGTGNWRTIENSLDPNWDFLPCFNTSLHGSIHWLDYEDEGGVKFISCFDFEDEKFKKLPLPPQLSPVPTYFHRDFHLGVLNGCLSMVLKDEQDTNYIWGMKHVVKLA